MPNVTLWLQQWAKLHGVLLEAYSPLGSNKQVKETLELPIVGETLYPGRLLVLKSPFLDQEGCGGPRNHPSSSYHLVARSTRSRCFAQERARE